MTITDGFSGFILFGLTFPGIFLAIPRLMDILLPDNTERIKKRISRIVIIQMLIMTFLMSLVGLVLSPYTGLKDPILQNLFHDQSFVNPLFAILLPALAYAVGGTLIFLGLYEGVVSRILDKDTLAAMKKIRWHLSLSACVLYGGIVEEVIVRWGLMNLITFFILLALGVKNVWLLVCVAVVSGLMYSMSQVPAYLAAGCRKSRGFIYSMLLLNSCLSLLFGWVFIQYGIIAAMITHMLFHFIWYAYEAVK